jgi:hypothetical protein
MDRLGAPRGGIAGFDGSWITLAPPKPEINIHLRGHNGVVEENSSGLW